MDVLRLAGSPGVGKSAVAWILASELADEGVPVGYVDIDQLGMCYPAPSGDPDRWSLKEDALSHLLAGYREKGAERLIVSGVAVPDAPPPGDDASTSSLWLDADEATRRRRLAPRGWSTEQTDAVLAAGSAEADRAHPAWTRSSTGGRTVHETARAVRQWWDEQRSTGPSVSQSFVARSPHRPSAVTWITGPRCSGASSVGWELASDLSREGTRTGFLDAEQLGFIRREDAEGARLRSDARLALRNTTTLLDRFATVGAERLIVVAPFEISPDEVTQALPGSSVTFIRLDADDDTRRERALSRTDGSGGPMLAGDDLRGADASVIESVVAAGALQRLTPARHGELLVDAIGREPSQIAADIRALS